MEEKKDNKKSILKFILVFILGVVLGAGALFGYNYLSKSSREVSNQNEKENNVSDSKDETDKKEEDKTETSKTYNLLEGDHYYYIRYGNDKSIGYILDGDDMKTVIVGLNTENILKLYKQWGVNLNTSSQYLEVNLEFDAPVKEIITGGRGQSISKDDPMLFLMQDGTVRYLNIINALTSPEFTANYNALPTPKTIEGLDNVIALFVGNYRSLNPTVAGNPVDTIAVKADGTLVHVMDHIN